MVEKIESLLKKQGKFEATLDGNLLFSGEGIIQIFKDPSKGYGFSENGETYRWTLPFLLRNAAAKKFTEMTFHQCKIVSFDDAQRKVYDCKKTYFFLDKPVDSVLLIPKNVYSNDIQLLFQGNQLKNIPAETDIEEVLLNSGIPYFIVDQNLSEEDINQLTLLAGEKKFAIVHPEISEIIKTDLNVFGFELKELKGDETLPWTWSVIGAKQIISLTEGVTNLEPYVADPKDAKIFDQLLITGIAGTPEEAMDNLEELAILLESGSLPIAVENISKETISPSLGFSFLKNAAFMGIGALIAVAIVIYIRYRKLKLVLPILFTILCEIAIVLGFAAAISWRLDLAAVAGIIAAVGTGVDDQIIISDELLKGEIGGSASTINRIKRAFFIIFAAAATTLAVMLPIVIFGTALGKIVGFAITTIAGVLIGVFITRPAFGEIIKFLLEREEKTD